MNEPNQALIVTSLSAVSGAPIFGALVESPLLCGRFRYSDLKEAVLSRAADLWVLNGVELLLVGWVDGVRMWKEQLNHDWWQRMSFGMLPERAGKSSQRQ